MTGLKNPSRLRQRLMIALVVGLANVMPTAIALQTPSFARGAAPYMLALLAFGCALAIPASIALTALQLHALFRPALNTELNDELATHNGLRAMAIGYVTMVLTTGYLLPLTVFVSLPITQTLTGILLFGIIAYLLSFIIFERQGDDG